MVRPRGCFDSIARTLMRNVLRAPDKRTEPETESKAETVVSKRAHVNQTSTMNGNFRMAWPPSRFNKNQHSLLILRGMNMT